MNPYWAILRCSDGSTTEKLAQDYVIPTFGGTDDKDVISISRDPDGRAWLTNAGVEKMYVNQDEVNEDVCKELHSSDTIVTSKGKSFMFFFEADKPELKENDESGSPPPPKRPALSRTNASGLEDLLTCSICTGILYQCESVNPCLHSFCKYCLLQWRKKGDGCPTCRGRITSSSKNWQLDAVLRQYLTIHPELDHSPEEKKILDEKTELLEIKDETEYNHSDSGDEEDDDSSNNSIEPHCDWCPLSISVTGSGCRNHLSCDACGLRIPSREDAATLNMPNPECPLCQLVFCCCLKAVNNNNNQCHCRGGNCAITLASLPDQPSLQFILLNQVETAHVLTYKTRKNLSDAAFAQAVLSHFGSIRGVTDLPDTALDANALSNVTMDTPLCWPCTRKCFQRLLYHWRIQLAPSEEREWPTRPDCYYGVNCHTQHRSFQHASKYNHCCPQTRRA